jgi:hypothetical protein
MQHVNHKLTNQPNKQQPTTTAKQTANHQPIRQPLCLQLFCPSKQSLADRLVEREKKKQGKCST